MRKRMVVVICLGRERRIMLVMIGTGTWKLYRQCEMEKLKKILQIMVQDIFCQNYMLSQWKNFRLTRLKRIRNT
jgi:hypothetical protein